MEWKFKAAENGNTLNCTWIKFFSYVSSELFCSDPSHVLICSVSCCHFFTGNIFHCEIRKCTGVIINVTANTCAFHTERSLNLNAVLKHDHQRAPLPFTSLIASGSFQHSVCPKVCLFIAFFTEPTCTFKMNVLSGRMGSYYWLLIYIAKCTAGKKKIIK